ncbi:MAG: glycosyltransferase family A protein, partial [Cyanobium sp.]|nr:glycosyltransferase family A protein [Cyanobium sp.]
RRWLNEERIHSAAVLAERLISDPDLIHNSNIPWLKPQGWYAAPPGRHSREVVVNHAGGLAELTAALATLGYGEEDYQSLSWEHIPFTPPAPQPDVQASLRKAARSLEATGCPVGEPARVPAPSRPSAPLTVLRVGRAAGRSPWDACASAWGCPLLHVPGQDSALASLLAALRHGLAAATTEAWLILFAALDDQAERLEQLDPALLIRSLPPDWGIVQLAPFWPIVVVADRDTRQIQWAHEPVLGLHRHLPGREWGCDALLVRRSHAEALLRSAAHHPFAEAEQPSTSADRVLLDDWSVTSPWRCYTMPLLQPARVDPRSGLERTMRDRSREHIQSVPPSGLTERLPRALGRVQEYPVVSIHTVTRNRPRHLEQLQRSLLRQTYPASRMEWVIVDSSEPGRAGFTPLDGPIRSRVLRVDPRTRLGAQRNLANSLCRGQIVVCCDDDDYYFPGRVAHAVESLLASRNTMCAGCTVLPIQFWDRDELWTVGPYTPNHTTANALAFRSILLEWRHFDPDATLAEENSFLAEFSEPMAQLDPWQSLVCMAHDSNTFRKQILFEKAARLLQPTERHLSSLMPQDVYRHCLELFTGSQEEPAQ